MRLTTLPMLLLSGLLALGATLPARTVLAQTAAAGNGGASGATGTGGASASATPARSHRKGKSQSTSGGAAAHASGTQQRTRAQLQALRARIHAISRARGRDAVERERLTAQLREAELALSKARVDMDSTGQAVAAQAAQRTALAARRTSTARELTTARAGLAAELRAAYLLGRDGGPLRLLLDQKDPIRSERLLMYYGYFSRAATARIARVGSDAQRLDALDAQAQRQQAALTGLQQQQAADLQALTAARERRAQVLVSLTARVQTREQQLAQLRDQQAGLEQLLQRLARAPRTPASVTPASPTAPRAPHAAEPLDLASAFGRLRGQLIWPVSGHLTAQFGQPRASGVSWDGMVIDTPADTPVHAVSAGRVVYADWLPGLGLLIIVDHGAGYLSLYAHNDRLLKAVGATVSAGEVIAAAGDTGGRAEPQLYFEIRHDGRPIDPTPWFRSPAPAP
jgi:septal ring factor EnvC (AmiA/AmiB activator)